jgi:phosphatidylglycerophosphate synthase
MVSEESPPTFEQSLKHVQAYPFVHKYLPVERYLIRPPAFLVVRALHKTAVTPNQLTYVSFILGLAAGLAYLGATRAWFAAAGVLCMVSSIFDCADGQLARVKAMSSRYGGHLDLFLDRVTDFAVISGLTLGWYLHTRGVFLLAFGLVTCAAYFLEVCLYYLINAYLGIQKTGEAAETRGVAITMFFVTSLAGRLDWMIYALAVYSFGNVLVKVFRFIRFGRRAVPPAGA